MASSRSNLGPSSTPSSSSSSAATSAGAQTVASSPESTAGKILSLAVSTLNQFASDLNSRSNTSDSNSDSNSNVTGNTTNITSECWNEYCWSEEDYDDHILEFVRPKYYEWIFIVIYFITFVVGLVGNALVCFAVWRNHNMRTVTNVFIVNLAVGDFLVILVCLPPTLVLDVMQSWFLDTTVCKCVLYLQVCTLGWYSADAAQSCFVGFFLLCFTIVCVSDRSLWFPYFL
ncbi:orexin receptor type 2 [Plakobranchus ocellatus]|uniref:Orexin receptor type 2 n=1 Tax=Plakobranchus ocellatus TaxID=259542 RepID=A0AAV4DNQ8_9GAST|nr:orexin receptor type 2 [Plakobranchus ocellatus]